MKTHEPSAAQIGDMYADASGLCPSGGLDCMPMLADAVTALNGAALTVTYTGVTMLGNDSSWSAAIAAVSQVVGVVGSNQPRSQTLCRPSPLPQVDTVLLCLGTDRSVAGEGTDREAVRCRC